MNMNVVVHSDMDQNGNVIANHAINLADDAIANCYNPNTRTFTWRPIDLIGWIIADMTRITAAGWDQPSNVKLNGKDVAKLDHVMSACHDPSATRSMKALDWSIWAPPAPAPILGVTANEQSDTATAIDTQSAE